jgi:bacteriocin-like protein
MSEDTKKLEKTEPEALATELSEQDLNKVTGGASSNAPIQERTVPTVSEVVVER